MSELRRRLVSSYAIHYQRLNSDLQSAGLDSRSMGYMEATYGPLIRALSEESVVLDLGCGTGALLEWLRTKPHVIPVGVDASESQIAVVRKRMPEVAVELSDGLEFLEKQPNRFAGIFCTDVLEHIPGDDGLLGWVEPRRGLSNPEGSL